MESFSTRNRPREITLAGFVYGRYDVIMIIMIIMMIEKISWDIRKTVFGVSRPDLTQTALYSLRKRLEA